MNYLTAMTTNNSKYAISNRPTAKSQYFIPLVRLITTLFGVSSISSHVTTGSSTRLSVHSQVFQVFTNLTILITLARTCTRIPGIILFTCSMFYCFFHSYWHLSFFHLYHATFTSIKFTSTLK